MNRPASLPFPLSSAERAPSADGRWREPVSKLMSGSFIMLLGSLFVAGFNFLYNVLMARMLGPAQFGHASAAVTLFMLLSAITLSFQLVCAKFIAKNGTAYGRGRVYHQLIGRAAVVGVVVFVGLVVFSGAIANFLHLPDRGLIIILAFGMAFYPGLGVKRGNLQGLCAFPKLSLNFIAESFLKLVVAIVLVAFGYGVMGAVGAIAVSVFLAFMLSFATPKRETENKDRDYTRASFREGIQAIVFFVGQVVISNTDVLVVKHFFSAENAGLFAAVALVGRVVFFASWSLISAMFPVSAAAKVHEHDRLKVIGVPLSGVALLSLGFIAIMGIFPGVIVHLFGQGFSQARPLLVLYATATGIYSMSVVLMAYEMSRRIANTGWLQLAFSGMLVLGISVFHRDLRQVIQVQIFLMTLLLLSVSLPFLKAQRSSVRVQEAA